MLQRLLAAALLLFASAGAWAGIPTFCDRADKVTAADQDRVLRFAAAVKDELARSGASLALVARAGLDLSRFGLLYSHAGIALKNNPDGPWAVRQLYYACDESRPRLFDQGMSGFVLGADAPRAQLREERVEALAAMAIGLGISRVTERDDAITDARQVGPLALERGEEVAGVVGHVALALG